METGPKSPAGLEISEEFNALLTEHEDAVPEPSPDIPIKEERVEELFMQELYRELYNSADPTDHLTSFLAGDAKSETCGASVSDSASTVMAGIEFAAHTGMFSGGNLGPPLVTGSGCWGGQMEKCGGYYCCNAMIESMRMIRRSDLGRA